MSFRQLVVWSALSCVWCAEPVSLQNTRAMPVSRPSHNIDIDDTHHFHMDFHDEDELYALFFDEVVIPSKKRLAEELDPHVFVGRRNASAVLGQCSMHMNKRILEADNKLIILGAGPAGLTAAVYAARAGMDPLVVSKDGGQLEATSRIDNFPGFEEGVDAVDLLIGLTHQAERFGAKFKSCEIDSVHLDCRPFRVQCTSGLEMTSSSLILASGARTKWLEVPGEEQYLSRGVHSCATCDGYFYRGKNVAVVGGGDTAMEQALFLARMAEKVTVIHRRDSFRASKAMATRVLSHPHIEILWETTILEYLGSHQMPQNLSTSAKDGDDHSSDDLKGIRIRTNAEPNESGESQQEVRTLPIDGVFVAVGHTPNTELFGGVKRDEYGYIYTVPGSTLTSVTGVYAAGDVSFHCVDPCY